MKTAKLFACLLLSSTMASASDFAFRLYSQLSKAEGNLFFSPASIEAALAMTAEGARGETRNQFNAAGVINFQCLENLMGAGLACFQGLEFENANAIWVEEQFPILGNFRTAVEEKHDASIRPADFKGQPNTERLKINAWVEEKTRDKIRNLLPDGSVSAMTRLLLVNAIYFKGDWLHAFDSENTAAAPFWVSPENSVPVQMMTLKGERFRYGENDCFQTLELPYEGKEVSMLLILPKAKDGLSHIENCFSSDQWEACTADMRKREVTVTLPRFKVESTFASLKRDLAALGLTDAFDAQRADFSGISLNPLFISDVVHKAFVEVNEEGTEAAAATGVIIRTTSMPAPPKVFRADRPLLFLIRENTSGKTLFMGRLSDPSK